MDRFGRGGDALSRHDQRNAGRVRNHHHGQRAAHELVDLHALDPSANQALVGVGRPHRHLGQRRVHVLLRLRQIVLAIGVVHLLAEILEAHLRVCRRMRLDQRRQHARERSIGVVEVLEVDELGDQRAPLALGDAHREQHEERVEAGLFDLDSPGRQELRHHGGRNAVLLHAAIRRQTRSEDRDLDRIDQDMIFGESLKPVPSIAGLQHPSGLCRLPAVPPSPRVAIRRTTRSP